MTARTALIYAKGGGEGHKARGLFLAERLRLKGLEVTLVVRRDQCELPGLQSELPQRLFDLVFMDTFPRGWREEIPSPKRQFPTSRRFLISRYHSDLKKGDVGHFDLLLSPYGSGYSEWMRGPFPHEINTGVMARIASFTKTNGKLLVLDPGFKISSHLKERMISYSESLGFAVEWIGRWDLQHNFEAQKVFVIGAGYNTFYEWIRTNADVRFLPLKRAWDDQFHRARRLGFSCESLSDWMMWMRTSLTSLPYQGNSFHDEILARIF